MLIDLEVEGFREKEITVPNNLSYPLLPSAITQRLPITTDCRLSDKQCFGHFLNFISLTLSNSHAWEQGRQGYIILSLLKVNLRNGKVN